MMAPTTTALGVVAVLYMVMRMESLQGGPAQLTEGGVMDPDDAMIVIPIGIALDFSAQLLLAAAIGALDKLET